MVRRWLPAWTRRTYQGQSGFVCSVRAALDDFFSAGTRSIRARRSAWAACGVALVLVPWVIRTWRITGSPVIYSNAGFALWTSNHSLTFDYFPHESIDAASEAEAQSLSPAEKNELNALYDPQGMRESRWFWNKGVAYIAAHPGLTARRAAYKVWIAFSPVFSPAKSAAFEALYFISYVSVVLLSCVMGSFALGSAVFWGHTGHRMYVEPYFMILAAYPISRPGSWATSTFWQVEAGEAADRGTPIATEG